MEEKAAVAERAEEEISLIDLFAVVWGRRVMILVVTLAAGIVAVVFSVISLALPADKTPLANVYTPQALMLINDNTSSAGALSSMLNNAGVGGLAGLMGVGGANSSNSSLAVYLCGTNSMLDAVTEEFELIGRYKLEESESPKADSRKALKKLLKAEIDEKSGVLSLEFTDSDPAFARGVVNYSVDYLERRFDEMGLDRNKREKENLERNIENTYQEILGLERESRELEQSVALGRVGGMPSIAIEMSRIQLELSAQRQVYTQLKIQYELLKVTMASEAPVFQVLEYAEAPDQKSGPSRGMLCVVVTLGAGFLAVFLAFAQNAVWNIRRDPGAMAKLRGAGKRERGGGAKE